MRQKRRNCQKFYFGSHFRSVCSMIFGNGSLGIIIIDSCDAAFYGKIKFNCYKNHFNIEKMLVSNKIIIIKSNNKNGCFYVSTASKFR